MNAEDPTKPPAPTAPETAEALAARLIARGDKYLGYAQRRATMAELIEARDAAVRERALEEAVTECIAAVRSLKKGPTHGG